MINKLKQYLKLKGLEFDFDKVRLNDDGDGVIYIGHWEYDIPKPSVEELEAVDSAELEVMEELRRLDGILPRHIEDALDGKTLYGDIKEAVERKKELREIIKG